MNLGGNDLLSQIENENPKLGIFLRQYVVPAIETTAQNAAVSPTANLASPAPIQSLSVAAAGEIVHVSHSDSSQTQKGINYFTEIGVNDPHFLQPIVYHHGTSRTPPPFSLPTKDASGTPYSYTFRGYSQFPGSQPSAPVLYNGGAAVTLTGSTEMDLLPSTGSGTASGSGTQGGQGFGKSQIRLATSTKGVLS